MKEDLVGRVRQVAVTDPVAAGRRYDYADAFAIRLPEPDPETPETWVLRGLQDVPAVVDRVAALLGVRDDPSTPAGRAGGWEVVESGPDVIQLAQSLPLMDVVLVGRRTGPAGRLFTSVLTYRRPVLARLVWSVVRLGHRPMVRRLLAGRGADAVTGRPAARAGLDGGAGSATARDGGSASRDGRPDRAA